MRRRDFCKLLTATTLTAPLVQVTGGNSSPISSGAAEPDSEFVSARKRAAGKAIKVRVHPGWNGLVTADNKPFIPFGAMYFRPDTGWTPRFWKGFDATAVRRDLLVLKTRNFNTVRLWLTSLSFYPRPGVLDSAAIEKFDQFLALAEDAGLYVQVCALTTWQGRPVDEIPVWQRTDVFADPKALEDQEHFWSLLASRYKGRSVIFTYELANEPTIGWSTPAMQALWNKWNNKTTPIPPPKDDPGNAALLAFQHFREHVADEWTRRQVAAIKNADPDALVTIGLVQWSVPAIPYPQFAQRLQQACYSAFRPRRQAKLLDFMEIHFYPLAAGVYVYQSEAVRVANMAYLESVVREVAMPGLPTVLGEFGWYGGGSCAGIGGGVIVPSQQQQSDFCAQEVRTATPLVCGWLNWAMYDDPVAKDITRFSGLFTADGKLKLWGKRFGEISLEYRKDLPPVPLGQIGPRPELPWDACLTNSAAAEKFRVAYLEAFKREEFLT